MHTIGEFLKNTRKKNGYTREDVSEGTKIKKSFVVAIENEKWDELPEYTVVTGFVKNIASFLNEDANKAIALLRRDYPPKSVNVGPKPDVSDKFVWSPRLTFFVGASVVVLGIIIYLSVQYFSFISPPSLSVSSPKENETVSIKVIEVVGVTDPDATIEVNGQSALVDQDGNFIEKIEVAEGLDKIEIKAVSRSGKETVVERNVIVSLDN
jgi:cytoskeletal protein RodZ